jgi:hypothetical protein
MLAEKQTFAVLFCLSAKNSAAGDGYGGKMKNKIITLISARGKFEVNTLRVCARVFIIIICTRVFI